MSVLATSYNKNLSLRVKRTWLIIRQLVSACVKTSGTFLPHLWQCLEYAQVSSREYKKKASMLGVMKKSQQVKKFIQLILSGVLIWYQAQWCIDTIVLCGSVEIFFEMSLDNLLLNLRQWVYLRGTCTMPNPHHVVLTAKIENFMNIPNIWL